MVLSAALGPLSGLRLVIVGDSRGGNMKARFQYRTRLTPEAITCEVSVSLVATHILDQSSEQWH